MKKCVLFLILAITVLATVTAAPPFTTQTTTGTGVLTIEYPKTTTYVYDTIKLNFHVFNSTGFPLDNTTVTCLFHMYNDSGAHVLEISTVVYHDKDFEVTIQKQNLSYGNEYSYIIQCEDGEAGFASNAIFINNLHSSTNTGYFFFMLIPLIFGLIAVIGAATLGEEHNALRIVLFLLSMLSPIVSLWFGSILVLEENTQFFTLVNATGVLTFIIGSIFGVLIFYFLLYTIYKLTHKAAQDNDERLNY